MQTVPSAAQSGLAFLHQYHQEHPLDLDDNRFVRLHEWFLHELSTIDTLADHLNATERANYGAVCSRDFHVVQSNVIIEVDNRDSVVVGGNRLGRVLVTHLHSYATPFVRYDIGDFATLSVATMVRCYQISMDEKNGLLDTPTGVFLGLD